jgi:hypothetical protein
MDVREYLASKGDKDITEIVKELLEANEKLEKKVADLVDQLMTKEELF